MAHSVDSVPNPGYSSVSESCRPSVLGSLGPCFSEGQIASSLVSSPAGPNSQSHSRDHGASVGPMRTVSRAGLWCGDSMGGIVKFSYRYN